jgi:phosphoglycerol transferase MdoB-like AlkP superfamily enzyme
VNSFKEPFFTVLFSLSSHEPYPIPERYENKLFPEENKLLRSVAYTDYSLQKFFDTVKNMEWFDNTLFVLCPDHISTHLEDESYFIQNRIPIIYYCNSDSTLSGVYNDITQQLDIFPSILDYLGYSRSFVSFGESIYRDGYKFAVSKTGVNFQVIDTSLLMVFDGINVIETRTHSMDSLLDEDQKQSEMQYKNLEMLTKAYLQNYYFRLNKNRLADTLSLYPN